MTYAHSVVLAIREMMERHWDVYAIAAKMKMDPAAVQIIITMITDQLT